MLGDYGMGAGWFGMGFGWILIVVLVVAAGIFLFRQAGGDRAAGGRESARDILDKRKTRCPGQMPSPDALRRYVG